MPIATCTYHKLGLCKVTILNKGIEFWCRFFVVLGNGPALLRIQSVNCITMDDEQKGRWVYEQTRQGKHQSFKTNPHHNNKIKQEIDYCSSWYGSLQGGNCRNNTDSVFTSIRCFKGTFSLQVKDNVKPYQVPPRFINYTL